jgi:hypothetical protein
MPISSGCLGSEAFIIATFGGMQRDRRERDESGPADVF